MVSLGLDCIYFLLVLILDIWISREVMGEREKRTSFFFLMAFEDDDDTDIGYSINKILKNLAIPYCPT